MESNKLDKVFVWGATYTNKGSEAMLDALKKLSKSHIIVAADYNSDLNIKRNNEDIIRAPQGIVNYFLFLLQAILFRVLKYQSGRYGKLLAKIQESSLVVDLSGFALSEDFSKNSCTYRSTVYLIQAIVSKIILSKRYVIMPQAIGPFERTLNKMLACLILYIADEKYIRGRRSHSLATQLVKSNVHLVSDLAFILEKKTYLTVSSWRERSDYVVVNPNSRIFHKQKKNNDNSYFDAMIELIEKNLLNGYQVVLTPNEIRENEFDDLDLCQEIYSHLSDKSNVTINKNVSLENLFSLVDNAKLCILSRFHLMIFSLMCNTPVIVGSWSDKYLDIMEDFELGCYCVRDYSEIQSKFALLLKEYDLVLEKIERNLVPIRKSMIDMVKIK